MPRGRPRKEKEEKEEKKVTKKKEAKTEEGGSNGNGEKKFVVASTVKTFLADNETNISGDLVQSLNEKVQSVLQGAIIRAQNNGRKTVRPVDL